MKPLISVLMPVYNAEKFLREAIESVLQQTLDNFEFIILDDASTDDSVSIIKSYNDARIKLFINEKNMGISATLNKGIDLASSELIARMDADDVCYPHRLEKQFRHFLDNPDLALLSCWARVVNEERELIRIEKYETPYYYYNLTFECWMYHPTIVFRRDAVNSIGKYTARYSEDYELFWQLSRKYKIGNIEEVLLDYRLTNTSLHQVVKKTEYDREQEKQVLRNIRFYMGPDFILTHEELECLRHNFTPMLQQNSVHNIIVCLKKLERISRAILGSDNINRDEKSIKEGAWHKEKFIIDFFARNLPEARAVIFLIKLSEWKKLYRLTIDYFKRKLKKHIIVPSKF